MSEDKFLEIVPSAERRNSTTKLLDSYSEAGHHVVNVLHSLQVVVVGRQSNPAILTLHDIGMNSISCFQGFFGFADMQPILKRFCVYHVTAPGQEESSQTLPANFVYPTLDELAEMIMEVVASHGIKSFVGFGVGAGANILSRFALRHSDLVDGLILVNCTASQSGWFEWISLKFLSFWFLKKNFLIGSAKDYILWHWFGQKKLHSNSDLLMVFIQFLESMNPYNLGCFIESYIRRTDLGIAREYGTRPTKNFKCPVLLLTGADSPHLEDTIQMNDRSDPNLVTWVKYDCSGMVLEEEPAMVTETILYFLQGLGYIPTLRSATYTKYLSMRKLISRN